jgi:hypothetical protein
VSATVEAPPLTLRQRAIAATRTAHEVQEAELGRRDQQNRGHAIEALRRAMERRMGVDVAPHWNSREARPEVVVDRLLFALISDGLSGWYGLLPSVFMACSQCSTSVPAVVGDLQQLGELLDNVRRPQHYDCPALPPTPPTPALAPEPARTPTTAEQLLAVLEQFIAERMSGGQP